jgi:hypothetical protein
MTDKILLESKLNQILIFEKSCIDSLDKNQKKEFEEKKYCLEVLLEDIQQKKNRQKINRENIVSEKKSCEKDILIYLGGFIVGGVISYIFSDSSSITFSIFVVLLVLYCIWRTNERNFQYLCEFVSSGVSDSSIYNSETQLKLLGVDSVEVISKVVKNEENINNSYNHIGELVKNSEDKIDLWRVETLIYKTKMSLMILKRIDNSFDTTRYTSVLF